MRKILRYVICTCVLFGMVCCIPENFDKNTWGPAPQLNISQPGVTLQATAGEQFVEITTNYDTWTAEVSGEARSWCSVRQENNRLVIVANANEDDHERTAIVAVTVGRGERVLTKEIAVTQLGSAPRVVVDPPVVAFELSGGRKGVSVTTNLEGWTPSVPEAISWCSVEQDGDRLFIKTEPYEGKEMRPGIVSVSAGNHEANTTVQVWQFGTDPALRVIGGEAFPVSGGTQLLHVLTNQSNWEVTVPTSASSWLTAEREGSLLRVKVDSNAQWGSRRCELTVTAGEGENRLLYNVLVLQLGREEELILSTDTLLFSSHSSLQTLSVFSNLEQWTAETDVDWCTLVKGDHTLSVCVKEHTGETLARKATIRVIAGTKSCELSVVQYPKMTLQLSRDTLMVSAVGGEQSVTVVTNQEVWRAEVPNNVSWCTVGIEGNELKINVLKNDGVQREALVTVSVGSGDVVKEAMLLVRQAAAIDSSLVSGYWNYTLSEGYYIGSDGQKAGEFKRVPVNSSLHLKTDGTFTRIYDDDGQMVTSIGNWKLDMDKLILTISEGDQSFTITSLTRDSMKLVYWDGYDYMAHSFVRSSEPVIEPEVDPYRVTLRLQGEAGEVNQGEAGKHLYGVQVMARPAGSTTVYSPYGYGVYDDSTQVHVLLERGLEYTINTTLLLDGKSRLQADSGSFAAPFNLSEWRGDGDAPQQLLLNTFTCDTLCWLDGIDRGKATLTDGVTYDRPDVIRYFGERLNYTPGGDEEVNLVMRCVSFVVTCTVDSLTRGRVRVEIDGVPRFHVNVEQPTVSTAISFANTNGGWTNASYGETVNVKFIWEKPNGLEREILSQQVTFKRNTQTTLHTVFKEEGMNMDIENKPLTDGEIVYIEGIIWWETR